MDDPSPSASERAARTRRIIGGGIASASNVVVFTVYQLVSLPVFLSHYGQTLYGDWIILFGTSALLSVSDLGVPDVIGSQMTMSRAAGKILEAKQLFRRMRVIARFWLLGLLCLL